MPPVSSFIISEGNIITEHPTTNQSRMKRAAIARRGRLWDFCVVPLEIDPIFSAVNKAQFKLAIGILGKFYILHASNSLNEMLASI